MKFRWKLKLRKNGIAWEYKRIEGCPERGRERVVIQNSEKQAKRGSKVCILGSGELPRESGCPNTLLGTHPGEKFVGDTALLPLPSSLCLFFP